MRLYHYFEKERGPFCNLSDLSLEDSKKVLDEINKSNKIIQCHEKNMNYNSQLVEIEKFC